MRNVPFRSFCLVLLLTLSTQGFGRTEVSALDVVRSFYSTYLENIGNPARTSPPELPFSAGFRKLIDENLQVCREYATGICGFGADGDIYLDSQEYETGLSLASSGASFREESPGVITVNLNVYPTLTTENDYYDRQITLKMTLEDGRWVVDDLWYGDKVSSRTKILKENEFYRKNPDPDSPHMQKQVQSRERPR